jgi:hypothetical protein
LRDRGAGDSQRGAADAVIQECIQEYRRGGYGKEEGGAKKMSAESGEMMEEGKRGRRSLE